MKEKTAVEWLIGKLTSEIPPSQQELNDYFNQALEFEKQKEQQLNQSLRFCRLFIRMCEGGMPHDKELKNKAEKIIDNL